MIRSIFHFQPPANWMNDPNGPVMIGGKLHMFYQHNPKENRWGNMSWGHGVSGDLVHWSHRPVALYPDMPYDKDGVFSGCCIVHEGRPHILYTGVDPEVLCLAIGDEAGENFVKYEGNPILLPPQGEPLSGWRDPFVWRQNGKYRMVIGSGNQGGEGFADQYISDDLIHWERMKPLAHGAGEMWECPNVLPDGKGNAAIIVSALPQGKVFYAHGPMQEDEVKVRSLLPYDLGDCFYAPNTLFHPDGRMIQWGWMREQGDIAQREAQGWQGMLTIPREIVPDREALIVRPIREMASLRGELLLDRKDFSLHSWENACKGIEGQHLEILLSFEGGSSEMVLEMLRAGSNACVRLGYDGSMEYLSVDTTSISGGEPRQTGGIVEHRGIVNLRIFIDATALEVFINDRETLTTRAYPGDECKGLRLYAQGTVRVRSLKIYRMNSHWVEE